MYLSLYQNWSTNCINNSLYIFTLSFNKYLLSTFHVPVNMLDSMIKTYLRSTYCAPDTLLNSLYEIVNVQPIAHSTAGGAVCLDDNMMAPFGFCNISALHVIFTTTLKEK